MSRIKRIILLLLVVILSVGLWNIHVFASDYGSWKQWNSEWGNIWLGNNAGTSMGKIGCRVTSIAIVCAKLDLVDESFTPGTFANTLKNIGAFTTTGAMNNWTDPEKIVNGLKMVRKVELSGMSISEKAKIISKYTTNGYACTICVKSGGHYVAGDYVSGDTVYIHDPGYNNRRKLFDYYNNSGITSIRVFKRIDGAVDNTNISSSSTAEKSNSTNTSSTTNQIISDGVYVISTKLNSNYVLDIADASKDDGANLQLWKNNGTAAQTFKVTHIGNGYYQIINTNSGKALDAQDGGTAPGTNVWQYNVNNTDAQIWKIVDAGGGYYYIICKKSGLYLDLNNANVDYGENIKLWTNNGNDAQKWKFAKLSSSGTSSSSNTQTKSSSTSIKFELESVPKGNLPYGKAFSLKGWFRSDSAIVEARAYILDANKNVVMQSDKASSTTSNYKIQGYKLDKAMKFNELSPGGYYLKYFVRDANGDTATWISDKFYIVK